MSPLKWCNMARTGFMSLSSTTRTAPQLRQVKIAHQDTATAVISEGLKEGDRVVTSGQFLLQPGSIVSIDTGSGT